MPPGAAANAARSGRKCRQERPQYGAQYPSDFAMFWSFLYRSL
jgi:hypothetical protein